MANGKILYSPSTPKHTCTPPEAKVLDLETIWVCFGCYRRYKVVYRDNAFGGEHCWTRRWWPWPRLPDGPIEVGLDDLNVR